MNREKLKALLKMGLITEKQYLTAEKRLPAADFTLPVLTLHLDLPLVTLDASETETSGGVLTAQTVTRYEELIESRDDNPRRCTQPSRTTRTKQTASRSRLDATDRVHAFGN